MGRKRLLDSKLNSVAGSVPLLVLKALQRLAKNEKRPLSAVVRRAIEESPCVKAEIRRNGKP